MLMTASSRTHIIWKNYFAKKITDSSLPEQNFGDNSKNIFPENELNNSINASKILAVPDLGEKNSF